jgi:hypothetical protein
VSSAAQGRGPHRQFQPDLMSLLFKISGHIMFISFPVCVIWFLIWLVRELAIVFFFL